MNIQILLTGLSVGVVYGVIGAGFVVIHRITRVVNFAQGQLAMAGAFGAVVAADNLGLPIPIALLVAALVGGAIAVMLYRLGVHPVQNHGLLVQTIVTLGAAIVLDSVAQLAFGSNPRTIGALINGQLHVLGGTIAWQAVCMLAVAALLYLALSYFFNRTMIGRAVSACAINRYAAGVVGINVVAMATVAFLISGAMTGLIGAMQTPLAFVTSGVGLSLSLKGFIAAILGGFEQIGVAIVGGLLVGIAEAYIATEITTSYQDVIVFSVLLLLLIVRPAGLTRIRVSERV